MAMNTAQFIRELGNMNKKIEDMVSDYIREIAEFAFDTLVDQSPVATGSYVLSHRIGLGAPNTSPPTKHLGLQLGEGAKQLAKTRKAELIRIDKKIENVYITNDIEYMLNVEFGWIFPDGRSKAGYFPFTNTTNIVRAKYRIV